VMVERLVAGAPAGKEQSATGGKPTATETSA